MTGNFEVLPPGNYISVETHDRICSELHIEDIEQAWDRTQFNGRAPIKFAREIEKVLKGEV